MLVLAIETSCDDTAAAVTGDGRVLSNAVASQDEIHADYGGVVPELAARRHLETIQRVIRRALGEAEVAVSDLDAIAVTRGPGLIGSLLVGVSAAQGLALRTGLPLVGVNHLEGHALSPLVNGNLEMPFLSMVVSGGHTAVYLVSDIGEYAEVAATCEDSAGEAFDKGAKMLGLGYPGGRLIDETARGGDRGAIRFPRGRVKRDPLAFSFSGLKTALWDYLRRDDNNGSLPDICASFQEAIVEVLVRRAVTLAERLQVPRIAVAGGVAANSRLRELMTSETEEGGFEVVFPPMSLCTDNAAMIAYVATRRLECELPGEELVAVSRLPLGPRLELT